MKKFLDKGFAERVPATEETHCRGRSWYLPHHAVVSEAKNKTRLVFDAASRYKGTSLNEQLLQGADLMNSLVGVLTRFRCNRYAAIADINNMFLQGRLTPEDKGVTKFLFWEDYNLNKPIVEYRMKRLLFGMSCGPTLATFALRQTAKDFGHLFPNDIAEHVESSAYVVDFLLTFSSISEGKRVVRELTDLLKLGGFEISKWRSNDKSILFINLNKSIFYSICIYRFRLLFVAE